MKTAPAGLAGALLIVSLCSCGMDRTMGSFDQEIALQNIRTNQHFLQQPYTGTEGVIQTAEMAHRNQEDLMQQNNNTGEAPNQTQHTALRSDPEAIFVMRDDQNRIRAIGKPALTTSTPSQIPDTNATDSEDRHDFMK
jgi:hypothetical protein